MDWRGVNIARGWRQGRRIGIHRGRSHCIRHLRRRCALRIRQQKGGDRGRWGNPWWSFAFRTQAFIHRGNHFLRCPRGRCRHHRVRRKRRWSLHMPRTAPDLNAFRGFTDGLWRRLERIQKQVGKQRLRLLHLQVLRCIEHLLAVPASHPAFRYPQLIGNHPKGGGAVGAAGDLAHRLWIVGAPLRPRAARAVSDARSSGSSHPHGPTPAAAATAHRPPAAPAPAAPGCRPAQGARPAQHGR